MDRTTDSGTEFFILAYLRFSQKTTENNNKTRLDYEQQYKIAHNFDLINYINTTPKTRVTRLILIVHQATLLRPSMGHQWPQATQHGSGPTHFKMYEFGTEVLEPLQRSVTNNFEWDRHRGQFKKDI